MAYLELKNITKKYDELVAVDELNFSVEKNEFAVLFGSSAAGKTTTLRCISGLEKIENGEVWFNNKDFTNAPIQGREMAMVLKNLTSIFLWPIHHLRVTLKKAVLSPNTNWVKRPTANGKAKWKGYFIY